MRKLANYVPMKWCLFKHIKVFHFDMLLVLHYHWLFLLLWMSYYCFVLLQFGKFQIAMAEAAKERGYSDDGDLVSIILCMDMEDDSILSFRMFWLKPPFCWASCMCVEYPERDAHSNHAIWWGNRLWYPLHRNCCFWFFCPDFLLWLQYSMLILNWV